MEIKSLCSNVGELTMILDLKDEKIEGLETGHPFVRLEVKAMSVIVSSFGEKTLRLGAAHRRERHEIQSVAAHSPKGAGAIRSH
ncbi:MAG: hypothetical protein ISN28_06045 [Ectothiorhodospiraceae bacterium AqS1]|nr:hypothetical protein [Ectothiorhodospiraceae bacterium AqS1]